MEDRVKRIVDVLLRGTRENKLVWAGTERENEYIVQLENGGVSVDSWAVFDDSLEPHALVDIGFLSKTGEVIDRVTFYEDRDPTDYRELKSLHDAARRNHLKVDEKLDNILEEIEKAVGPGDGF
jgi:hypothetical protein